jgi:DNA-directed RNA polymerase specialized sigma24 family protein
LVNKSPPKSSQIQAWIDRLSAGEEAARDELIRCTCDRLADLIMKMLGCQERGFVADRAEELIHRVTLRLYWRLAPVSSARSREFFWQASVQIRRELIDLGASLLAADDLGTEDHGTRSLDFTRSSDSLAKQLSLRLDHARLSAWVEFHRQIDVLAEDHREAFGLLWYQGLTESETANLLGLSLRTMIGRWQSARLSLYDALDGQLPPLR